MHHSDPPTNEPGRPSVLSRLIATAMFTGYIPWASGTFGSLLALLLLLLPGTQEPATLGAMILLATATGIPAAGAIARSEGHRLTRTAAAAKRTFQPGEHDVPDPSIVVIDEVVGMWITLFMIAKTLPAYALGFLLFRVLDILKPEPARLLERVPGGWGIMLDDIVAGIYANAALRALLWAAESLRSGFSM